MTTKEEVVSTDVVMKEAEELTESTELSDSLAEVPDVMSRHTDAWPPAKRAKYEWLI